LEFDDKEYQRLKGGVLILNRKLFSASNKNINQIRKHSKIDLFCLFKMPKNLKDLFDMSGDPLLALS
jgi:hypothetical protein